MAYYVPAYAPVYALADPEHERTALDLAVRDMKEKEEIGKAAQQVAETQKAAEEAQQAAEADRAAAEAAAEKVRAAEEEAAAARERAEESKKASQEQLEQYTAQRAANQATESQRSAHAMSPQRVRLVGGYPAVLPPPLAVGYPPVYSAYYPPVVTPVYAVPDPVHESVAAGLADRDAKEKEEVGKAAQQYCEKKKTEEEAAAAKEEAEAAAAAAKEEAEAAAAAAEAAEEKSRQAKEAKDAQVDEFAAQRKKNQETEVECVVHASSPRRLHFVPAFPPVHYAALPPPPLPHVAAPPPPPAAAAGGETEFARAIRERDEACARASVARARADPTTA